jgi:diadenylate cyclase
MIAFEQLFHPRSLVEIVVLATLFYAVLGSVRGTRGAGILKGILFLFIAAFIFAMYAADLFALNHIKRLLEWMLSISALALLIIFHPELRRALSRLAQSPLLSPLLRGQAGLEVKELAEAAVKLSRSRIGAIIAIERDVGLGEYVENGVLIGAAVKSELLETIFYPGSPLHDGAVIVQHDRVAAAACLLPLTDDPTLSKSMGTRHRAAIGVSEETGRISVAVGGKLTTDLSRESLEKLLHDLYARRDRPTLRLRKESEPPAPPLPASGLAEPSGNGPAGGNGSAAPQEAPKEARPEEKA